MTEPILIWGAGAIGGTLGAAFVRAGQPVVFVDRAADHITAIGKHGLRIEGPLFQDRIEAPAFTLDTLTGRFERAFLCVKAHHTAEAIVELAPHVTTTGCVVSAQNGLNEHVIAAEIGAARTIGCFVNFGADYLEPGVVHYSGRGAVVIGELDGIESPRVTELWRLLSQFEPAAVLTPNIWGYLWGKMVYGALLFATALTDDSIADVLADGAARPVLVALGREVGAVAAAEGLTLEGFDGFDPRAFAPDAGDRAVLRSFDDMVTHNRRSTKSHSGIWRDLAVRKRPTEVDAQLGPIVEIAAHHGIATPLAARVIAMIHEIERGDRILSRGNLDELAQAGAKPAGAER